MKLKTGQQYDQTSLQFDGWSDGDGSGHEGYNIADYVGDNGAYLGPDNHGIEPIFATTL